MSEAIQKISRGLLGILSETRIDIDEIVAEVIRIRYRILSVDFIRFDMEHLGDRVVARDEEDSFPCLFHEKMGEAPRGGERRAPKARRRGEAPRGRRRKEDIFSESLGYPN
jgi:hypothetical protein